MGLLIFIVVLILVILDGFSFVVVSIEEIIDSVNKREMKELWKLQHHDLSVCVLIFLEQMSQKHLDGLVLVEFHSDSQCGAEVEIDLNNEILLTKVGLDIEMIIFVLESLAHFFDEGAVNLLVDALFLSETVGDLFWECEAKVTDCFTLKHFLSLVELLSDKLVEIVVQNEVLKFGQLHRHELLLNLVQDEVCFTCLQITIHVDSLS